MGSRTHQRWLTALLGAALLLAQVPSALLPQAAPPTADAVDGDATVIATIPVDTAPTAIAANTQTRQIYVAHQGASIAAASTVKVIDAATNTVSATIGVGANPSDIEVDETANRIYVVNNGGGTGGLTVSVIDGATNMVIATLTDVGQPLRAAVNPVTHRLFVTNGSQIAVFDTTTNSRLTTLARSAYGIAVDATLNRLYVGSGPTATSPTITVLNGSDFTPVATLDVGASPNWIVVDSPARRAYASGTPGAVVIDTSTNTVMGTITLAAGASGLAVDPTRHRLYSAEQSVNKLAVIDTTADVNTVLTEVSVGGLPQEPAVDTRGDHVFTANFGGNTVSVIGAAARPDLIVTSFTAPSTVRLGGSATFTWTIKNQGTATATMSLEPPVWGDQAWLSSSSAGLVNQRGAGGTTAKTSLAPGASYTNTFTASVPSVAPGQYYFILQTDSNAQILESDETNNLSVAVPVTVLPPPNSVAYVYTRSASGEPVDIAGLNAFTTLLQGRGYFVDPVAVDAAASHDFSPYAAIVIGADTGNLATWGSPAAVKQIAGAGRRIVGIGEGGYAFFGKLGLGIGYPNAWHSSGTSATVVDGSNKLWTTPNATSLATGSTAALYGSSTGMVSIYQPTSVTGVSTLGREVNDANHYPLIAQQQSACDVLWGFGGSPAAMTALGKDVFHNAIAGDPCGAPPAPTITGTAQCGDFVLAGARVDLFSGTSLVATTTASRTGAFSFSGIAPGTYAIRFTLGTTTCGGPVTVPASGGAVVQGGSAVLDLRNHSWPSAYRLNPVASPGVAVSADEHLFTQGQSAWFKFTVHPGASAVVTLTGLPANYDLTLYKNISGEYTSLTTQQLVQIGAETSPDAFSPDAFSPDAFSPDAFSPDAFSPDAFSPDAFSPDAFSPDAFSPDAFSPDAFSPDAFSPDAFSPDAFSPDAFSPATFSPDAFSPDAFSPDAFSPDAFSSTCNPTTTECVSPAAYSNAQTRSLIAVSAFEGTASEGVFKHTWDNTGDFYVRVKGRNGAFSLAAPFHLQVTYLAGSCETVTPITTSTGLAATSSGRHTIILWDSARTTGTDTAKAALGAKLGGLAAATNGVVVDVSADQRVAAANAQADTNYACPYAKNVVAGEIKRIVDTYRVAGNPLEYVVLVGGDSAIPFFRSPDQAGVGSEKGYVPPVKDASASQASLKLGYVLGQDAYGATTTLSLKDHVLPLPDAAVGRLVETADDAIGLIDAFLGQQVVAPTSALVTGYDFMTLAAIGADGTGGVKHELDAAINGTSEALVEAYGLPPTHPSAWNADQLRTALLGSRHDLIFLGGHFSAVSALAADYTTRMLSTDVVSSSVDLTNAIIFSQGCHSGYNIVDGDAVPGVTLAPDFPQAFARKKATIIAGTGYQYGDTDFVAYNEQIYVNFAQQLRTGTGVIPVGKALVAAKRQYLAATAQLRAIDEKALLETTLFGLPMLGVNVPGARLNPATGVSIVPGTTPAPTGTPGGDVRLGLQTADVSITPTLTSHTVQLRDLSVSPPASVATSYLSGTDGVVVKPAEPVLPLELRNVTVAGTVLRGVGFRGGTFADATSVRPLTGAPATEIRGVHAPFVSSVLYPVRPWSVNYFDALSGGPTRLAVTPAQFVSSAPNSPVGTRRAFSQLDFRLFYSAHTGPAATAAAPYIAHVAGVPDGAGHVVFSARVTGDPSAGIQAAWITYAAVGGTTWTSVDLTQHNDDSTLWTATLTLPASTSADQLRFVVQAASGVGLVALDTNGGAFYTPGPDSVQPQAPKSSTSLALQAPATSGVFREGQTFTAVLSGPIPLGGRVITFGVGSERRRGVTDASGLATATLPLYQAPGSYQVTASFDETSDLLGSSASAPFTITKQGTSLALGPACTPLAATLRDSSATQRTMRDQAVFLKVTGTGGTRESVEITDFGGRAVTPSLGLPAGSYAVAASYATPVTTTGGVITLSDERYAGSTASSTLEIAPTDATTSYTGATLVQAGSPLSLAASVSTTRSLTGAVACFRVLNGAGAVVAVGSAPITTGTATTTIPGLAGGVYSIEAVASGGSQTGGLFVTAPGSALLAVFDPSTFVTGGGWVAASTSSPNVPVGTRANFGFNLKYKTGTTIPTGSLEVQIKDAGVNFKATSFAWLAISGFHAEYEGTGTINGAGSYSFHVIADQSTNTFDIAIWDASGSYAAPKYRVGGTLGGGTIKVHS